MKIKQKSKFAGSLAAASIWFLAIAGTGAHAEGPNSAPSATTSGLRSEALAAMQQGRNLSVMEQIAFAYHMAGDGNNFDKAKERAFQYRLSTNDPKIVSNRLLFDYFQAGNARVFVDQCYKAAPPLRIKYRFDVMDPSSTAPGGQALRAFLPRKPRGRRHSCAGTFRRYAPSFFIGCV